jgi:hypothetical protein
MAIESQGWFGNLLNNLILLIISPFLYFFGAFFALFGNDWYWLQDQLIESTFLSPQAYGAAKVTFN